MMGSPFYYDVLFDDGPGDVVFHDCMWSGICTCCIQLLHQDSYYQFANESPDLKVEDLNCRTQQLSTTTASSTTSTSTIAPNNSINSSITSPVADSIGPSQFITNNHSTNNIINNNNDSSNTQPPLSLSAVGASLSPSTLSPSATTTTSALTTSALQNQIKTTSTRTSAASAIATAAAASCRHLSAGQTITTSVSSHRTTIIPNINSSTLTSCRISPDTINSSSSSSSSSSASSPSSSSPNCSNSTSPKPIRRREHNDSERKRRDHLRNAFNFLRDQVPRFKAINKKPPRIQILHEATKYVQAIMNESEDLARRLEEEKARHERLKLI